MTADGHRRAIARGMSLTDEDDDRGVDGHAQDERTSGRRLPSIRSSIPATTDRERDRRVRRREQSLRTLEIRAGRDAEPRSRRSAQCRSQMRLTERTAMRPR